MKKQNNFPLVSLWTLSQAKTQTLSGLTQTSGARTLPIRQRLSWAARQSVFEIPQGASDVYPSQKQSRKNKIPFYPRTVQTRKLPILSVHVAILCPKTPLKCAGTCSDHHQLWHSCAPFGYGGERRKNVSTIRRDPLRVFASQLHCI